MKMTFKNFTKWSLMSFSAFFLLTFISCEVDSNTGCTDSEAENYDIDAILDSGNCTYASDKMIGDYLGSSECGGSLTNPGFNNSSFNFSVAKSLTEGENDVEVSFSFEGVPFAFRGVVAGDVITISDQIMGVEYPNPADPTETIMVDVEGSGTMTYFDDDFSLDCPELVLRITAPGSGSTIQEGSCKIIGIKQ